MDFGTFLTTVQELFRIMVNGLSTLVERFSRPVADDLTSLFPNDSIVGNIANSLLEYLADLIGTDITYFGLMVGTGLSILIVVTIVKWVTNILP